MSKPDIATPLTESSESPSSSVMISATIAVVVAILFAMFKPEKQKKKQDDHSSCDVRIRNLEEKLLPVDGNETLSHDINNASGIDQLNEKFEQLSQAVKANEKSMKKIKKVLHY